jgi:hypothetical protein
MDVIELIRRLHFLRLPVGHSYLWQDADRLTLIDIGMSGSGGAHRRGDCSASARRTCGASC